MRPVNPALLDWLSSSSLLTAYDLWTFKLLSGEIFRYSGASVPLIVPGTCWASNSGSLNYSATDTWTFTLGPVFRRGRVKCKIGVEPQPLDVEMGAMTQDLIGVLTWQEAIFGRLFDGATVELDRFYPGPGGYTDTSNGCLVWFYGLVSTVDFGRTGLHFTVKSPLASLAATQMPRRIYGANCTHVFGAPMCGYNRTAGTNALGATTGFGAQAVLVSGFSSQIAIATGFTPSVATAYNEGTIIGTSGQNSGYTRTIASLSGGIATLVSPLIFPVAIGDGFTLLPGCDHTLATCNTTFQNIGRFGGYPYIPPPEQVI